MNEVTQEMLAAGAEIWWQTREQPLYPRLEAAYRAMRALEPVNTPSPPQTRVPEASEDPG